MDPFDHTREGLPRVTPETIETLMAELRKDRDTGYTTFFHRLGADNPVFADPVKMLMESVENGDIAEDFIEGFYLGTFMVYEGLRRQAEANKLKEQLDVSQEPKIKTDISQI